MTGRWEKERGAWILARAGRRAGARRRGEILMAKARRQERHNVGVGDAAVAEAVTPPWIRRSIMREEGLGNQLGWAVYTIAVVAVVGVAVGPALALGWAMYALWAWRAPAAAVTPRWWPFAATALVVASAAWATWVIAPPEQTWLGIWLRAQPAVAFLYAAWLTVAWGWPAVADDRDAGDGVVDLLVPVTDVEPVSEPVEVEAPASPVAPQVAEPAARPEEQKREESAVDDGDDAETTVVEVDVVYENDSERSA